MNSICRSFAVVAARTTAFRAKTSFPKCKQGASFSSRRSLDPILTRSIVAAVGGMESLMPLHSAIASARLNSFIAVDSSRWSWLIQGQTPTS
ncbi:hypothetical protein ZOSMA_86G00500 [Zostera marina]|uniref:Uncharacterized protein n=1 Tax=Zostera marina TaxID=29655 RepID=A0A0K9NKV9_ZOSMR|nr:hypothetical protein ZOSMA_86G00500 [Zostera marina]